MTCHSSNRSIPLSCPTGYKKFPVRRILPFDRDAARAYADIVAGRRQSGRPMAPFDAQIAAITRSRDAGVVTRNERDFSDCGIKVINPWSLTLD